MEKTFKTKKLPKKYDYLAPDNSEIRNLLNMTGGGLAHCKLPSNSVSSAVKHKKVEELWYFIKGSGEFWRKLEQQENITKVESGVCISIPPNTSFQFRTFEKPLEAIITTMPPWPGPEEAIKVKGRW